MAARRSLIRWVAVLAAVVGLGVTAVLLAQQRLAAFGVAMNPPDQSHEVDPREALNFEPIGMGSTISALTIVDTDGRAVATRGDGSHRESTDPLAFGMRYDISVTVERPWLRQRAEHHFVIHTVAQPRLEGRAERMLEADGSVTVKFDHPVGSLEIKGDVPFRAQSDGERRSFKLSAESYPAGQTFPLELSLTTVTGVPIPPIRLAITTAPPLTAKITPHDMTDLGVGLPIEVTFSEPVADRASIGQHFVVQTADGRPVAGRWFWYNSTRLRFAPSPTWPAHAAIEVKFDPEGVKSQQGGMIAAPLSARFSTGADKRIFVYLDKQQVAAVENGEVVRTFRVSTGKAKTPTVTGSFYIYARFPLKTMRSRAKPGQPGHYVVENVPFAQYFYSDYAFHGAWWHNGFGHPASHGCVNMSTRNHNRRWPSAPEDAGWLYRWAALGVPVTVFRTSPTQTQVALNK
ncbi:L,D-transpeptidase [Methylotetracoccus oryzae]|uniref:L,D-transpeptidase n=1 Tax=Methylotetracoccus oryzae TaxID=1919059 RepID=UPI00111BCA13|nr:L,D-transpeptidase [Methylotetracoccus oryzae]